MKVLSIYIMKTHNGKPVVLTHEEHLKHISFFVRHSARDFIKFAAKEIYSSSETMKPKTVIHEHYLVHSYKMKEDGLGAIMITDDEYSPRIAMSVLKKVVDEFVLEMKFIKKDYSDIKKDSFIKSPYLKKMIDDVQDPKKVDHIENVKYELDNTIETLQETIEKVLERGSKLDDLVIQTEHLSNTSKMFYKEAKKQNDCCNIS